MESHFILKDFIEKNSLMDNHQRINFKANVTIDTELLVNGKKVANNSRTITLI